LLISETIKLIEVHASCTNININLEKKILNLSMKEISKLIATTWPFPWTHQNPSYPGKKPYLLDTRSWKSCARVHESCFGWVQIIVHLG